MYRLSESKTSVRTAPVSHKAGARLAAEVRRVLIADDNRDWADGLAILLERQGYKVRTAYDGREALEAARAFRPHVVVLDVRMPEIGGLEAGRVFSRHPSSTRPVLIAVTAWPGEAGEAKAAASGFDHYLAKPAAVAQIVELLESA